MKWILSLASLSLWIGCAIAAETTVYVADENGAPVAGAVVWTEGGHSDAPDTMPAALSMAQENKAFAPYVLAVPTGARVEFPNRDRFRHHVYSFSKGNRFELELYGREEQRYVAFDTPGVVAVGCNIHDDMIGYIRVMDYTDAIYTDDNGIARIIDTNPESHIIHVWHPNGNNGEPWQGETNGDTLNVTMSMDSAYSPATTAAE